MVTDTEDIQEVIDACKKLSKQGLNYARAVIEALRFAESAASTSPIKSVD